MSISVLRGLLLEDFDEPPVDLSALRIDAQHEAVFNYMHRV